MVTFRPARMRAAVVIPSVALLCASALLSITSLASSNESIEAPQFRPGLWSFQRTIERLREAPHQNQLLSSEEMTRCVNPTLAMKAIFSSPAIGSCTSSPPQQIDNVYVFAKRCDAMGPVRTEITVESEESYTEMNVLTVGVYPRLDFVVARRVGECDATAGYRPSSTSDGFQLSGSSKLVRKNR
jgi:hypothetical protein